jgi:arginine:ornithine antiporter/lysine permease
LAAVYCAWLLYAAGLKYLLLSALLYAPGAAISRALLALRALIE